MKGTKPDFHGAMANEPARELYEQFLEKLSSEFVALRGRSKIQSDKVPVLPGAFGEYMNIETTCDGPVTLVWESQKDPKAVAKMEKLKAREAKIAAQRAEKAALKQQAQQEAEASAAQAQALGGEDDDRSMASAQAAVGEGTSLEAQA